MFKENKYTKWYWCIIDNARRSNRNKQSGYFESHHIIPKGIGGLRGKDNQVLLTAREHFVCHLLLCRMTAHGTPERAKMLHAFMLMRGSNIHQRRYINARLYAALKIEYGLHRSRVRRGKKLSDAHKKKIAASRVGRSIVTQEGRARISALAKARVRKPFSALARQNISAGMRAARAARLAKLT